MNHGLDDFHVSLSTHYHRTGLVVIPVQPRHNCRLCIGDDGSIIIVVYTIYVNLSFVSRMLMHRDM
jgi:hypothetical protein